MLWIIVIIFRNVEFFLKFWNFINILNVVRKKSMIFFLFFENLGMLKYDVNIVIYM